MDGNIKKSKLIGSLLGIFGFIALVAGATYAWLTWRSNNIIIAGSTECFDINYPITREIGTTQNPAKLRYFTSYNRDNRNQLVANPLYAEVALSINQRCTNVAGTGTIYLTTNSTSTDSSILGGALKYTLTSVTNNTETVISTAAITSTNEITLKNDINVTTNSGSTVYRVYVWLDGSIADDTYLNKNYVGSIRAEVVSKE